MFVNEYYPGYINTIYLFYYIFNTFLFINIKNKLIYIINIIRIYS